MLKEFSTKFDLTKIRLPLDNVILKYLYNFQKEDLCKNNIRMIGWIRELHIYDNLYYTYSLSSIEKKSQSVLRAIIIYRDK